MENLLMLLYDGNDHIYQADTFSTDVLRLPAPDADHLRYSIPAEELDERETIEEGPAEICLEKILRQFGRDQDKALCLCLHNRTAEAAEIILCSLLWVTSDAVVRGMSQGLSLICVILDCFTDHGLTPFLLGILYDDAAVHLRQLRLWSEFNICCLAVWQKQKDLTQASMTANIPLPDPCLSISQIETFGAELIAICDRIEKHGLVDYEVGVWEEEILSILHQCWSLSQTLSTQLRMLDQLAERDGQMSRSICAGQRQ
ncbi:uncharacterized protein AKAW2_50326A [Aspergillus luchuensis]|uniref:Uncharacterized protein n=1 Tax=Aspergillus kawachii TaxID=1069201 RepID=A0A7R7WBN0_ASPKA|nr:uncharacterized protein AKAW2_50326A [Aspergillus luchuensis]BCR99985.1 hypothetical protein AKAW2_50326A [Aspergillus luchuensis]